TARPRALDILAALSREIPADLDVEATRLVIGTDNLTLTGNTAAFNAVDDIKTRLEKFPMFKDVTIAAANIDNRSNRVRFTINIGRLEVGPWPSN
ncbi:MAG: PilN domain-containing protein, partial [Desulfobacteraceae bacterium]|nr:PilN domain-containing protein [Desulfobacteraceae bacterium]